MSSRHPRLATADQIIAEMDRRRAKLDAETGFVAPPRPPGRLSVDQALELITQRRPDLDAKRALLEAIRLRQLEPRVEIIDRISGTRIGTISADNQFLALTDDPRYRHETELDLADIDRVWPLDEPPIKGKGRGRPSVERMRVVGAMQDRIRAGTLTREKLAEASEAALARMFKTKPDTAGRARTHVQEGLRQNRQK
jgi:hypothetical protein